MKTYQIHQYRNEQLVKEFVIEASHDLDVSVKIAPHSKIRFGNQLISSLKLKGTDIVVDLSQDGVFFYFTPSGEEAILDDLQLNWLLEPIGAYHSKMLELLDVETFVFTIIP